uniref:TFIIS N-terminal domain-containing protein n=1 Tax=Macrostomum lignano TaxID=282301 RepID=A0A1I8H1B2_9PLAT
MVEDLATIISLINNATDLDKKMVTSAQQLSQAASMLESFPMTRAHLETTRLGKLLNEVRRFTDSTDLQRRLRRLLKGWQPLVSANDPNYSVVVNGNGSNPVPAPPAQVVAVQPAVDEATVPVANAASVDGESGSVGSVGSSASAIVPPPAATPSSASVRIRKRAAANAAAGDTASSAPAVPAKLAKVRSTAELLTGREGLRPETLARILNNEVPRETDGLAPEQTAARQQQQQQQQTAGGSTRKRRRLDSPASAASSSAAALASASAAALPPDGESALLHKFLESAVSHP